MQYVTLGRTGLKISRLGFGGIPIQRVSAAEAGPLLDAVLSAGINYIDTARGYTVSEELIGQAIEGRRDQFVLATKSMARDREAMEADIQTSLANLRTDHIDLYQVHNPTVAQLEQVCAPGGALEALLEAREAGKIGHIGLTAHGPEVFERALELDWVETVMFPYNIVESQGAELMERARAQAEEFGHSPEREVCYLAVHSVLHLLGYDHLDEGPMKAQMREREEAILEKLGITRGD